MALESLDRISINPADLERSIAFHTEVLGLENGDRPDFSFPGAWIYCGGRPVVHLIGGRAGDDGTGAVDHFAFRGSDAKAFTAKLEAKGIEFRQRDVPGRNVHQVFLQDPDGVTIEVNFTD